MTTKTIEFLSWLMFSIRRRARSSGIPDPTKARN
jgi:hypothetical protein